MTRQISKAEELKETCRQAHKYSQEFYEELLKEYAIYVLALRSTGDSYPWEEILELQDKQVEINQRLPNVTDEEFNEYIFNNDLLGILLEPLRR